ncbi:MAG: hypothetical protein WCK18_05235 [Prolixibacteraceae bacterium]
MNLINSNPFRILGLPITASEREIAKQINLLETYAEMGKTKSFDNDFPFLSSLKRTPQNIEEAKKQIEQSESKFLYSLFWFWNNNSVDELVLEVLKEGNTNKAIEIWEKSVFADKDKIYLEVPLIWDLISYSTQWLTKYDEFHILKKNAEEFIIEKKEKGVYFNTVPLDFNYEGNWTIGCDIEWISGIEDNGYGILFGKGVSNYYCFHISANGQYRFYKKIDGQYDYLLPWKESDSIKKRGTNNIQIKKISDVYCFFVNGVFLNTWNAEPFFGNSFGFIVCDNQKISFKHFKFCELDENDTYGIGIKLTKNNFSSLKNLSTLYLSLATNNGSLLLDYFTKGIDLAKAFFESERVEDYSKLIAGERFVYSREKALHFYINDIISSLKNFIDKSEGISISQIISIFSSFPLEAKQFINNRFVSSQIQKIDNQIDIADTLRKKSAVTATDTGKTLIKNTKTDIEYLKNILGESDFQFQIIADKLSLSIVQCGIDAFNVCKDSKGEIDHPKAIKSEEGYRQEYEFALSIAVTQRAKERAKENLDSCLYWIKEKHLHTCWFCGQNQPEKDCKLTFRMYKITSRDSFPQKSVKYKTLNVDIVRCIKCKEQHQSIDRLISSKNEMINNTTTISSLIISVLTFVLIGWYTDDFGNGIVAGFLVAVALIGGLSRLVELILKSRSTELKSKYLSKFGVKGMLASDISNYPEIKTLIDEGWTFSYPTA